MDQTPLFSGIHNPSWLVPSAQTPFILTPDGADHQLIYRGGRILPQLQYVMFFLGDSNDWDTEEVKDIDDHLHAVMTDPGMNRVLEQYFNDSPVGTRRMGRFYLSRPPKVAFSQQDIWTLLIRMYRAGKLDAYRGQFDQTVFVFCLPYGVVLTQDPLLTSSPVQPDVGSSLTGLGGYHGSVHPEPGVTLYYAVSVYPDLFESGRFNGIRAFDDPWKTIVAILYHELQEVRTDPDVEDVIRGGYQEWHKLGWVSAQGEEVGDYPVIQAGGNMGLVMREFRTASGTFSPTQLLYSNLLRGAAGPQTI